jgi:DNA-binding transcriptional regulator PaaX
MEGISLQGTVASTAINLADLYDLSELNSQASALADNLEKIEKPPSPRECYSVLLRMSGQVVQLASHNPRLPSELISSNGLNRLLEAFRTMETALSPGADEFLKGVLEGSTGGASEVATWRSHNHADENDFAHVGLTKENLYHDSFRAIRSF